MTDRIGWRLWQKQDRTTTWLILQVQSTLELILNFRDRLDWVLIMTKTKLDNYVIDRTDAVYAKNETELS